MHDKYQDFHELQKFAYYSFPNFHQQYIIFITVKILFDNE